MKASDNQFPKVTLAESAAPGTPASGLGYIYASTGGTPFFVNDAGTTSAMIGNPVASDVIWDAKGDLAVGTGSNTAQRLAAGTNGYALVAASGETTGLKWEARTGAVEFVFDGGGTVIGTGIKGDIEMPFAGTFTAWRLLADTTGSIVVDIWKDTYANFPPTDADSMPGTATPPTLSSATKAEDTSITDWTTDDFSAGDILRFNVDSGSAVSRVTLSLTYTRT